MKKLLLFLMIFPVLFAVSCDDKNDPTPPPTEYTVLENSFGFYLGDEMDKGTGLFNLLLFNGDAGGFERSSISTQAKPTTDIEAFQLTFVSNIAPDAQKALPAVGKYVEGKDGSLFTFFAGEDEGGLGTVFATYKLATEEGTLELIVGGTFEIAQSGTTYTVTIDLVDDKGVVYNYKYVGPLVFVNESTEFTQLENGRGEYYGDFFGVGTGNFVMELYNGEFDDYGGPTTDMQYYFLDLSSLLAVDNFNAQPELGEYYSGTNYQSFTFAPGVYNEESGDIEGSYFIDYNLASNVSIQRAITSGYFNIMKSGSDYIVRLRLIDELWDEHNCEYRGTLDFENYVAPEPLNENLNITGFAMVEAMPLPFFYPGNWYLTLCGTGISSSGTRLTGTGDAITFDVYMNDAETAIDVGEYIAADETMAPFTFTSGYTGFGYSGSWYYGCVNDKLITIAPIVTGTLKITKEVDTYTVVMDTQDDKGHKITGTYVGEFTLFDITGGVAPKYTPHYLNGKQVKSIAPVAHTPKHKSSSLFKTKR